MGGINENYLKKDNIIPKEEVLLADSVTEQIQELQNIRIETHKQTQEIRQHISAGHVHLHEDTQKLKVCIPVSDWFTLLNKLKNLQNFTYIDTQLNCVAHFKPYVDNNNVFEVTIELKPIVIGPRFKLINELARR